MAKEIERKFLVKGDDFKLAAVSCVHIVQGYISRESGRTVRVRLEEITGVDKSAWLTIKGPSSDDGLNRNEWEFEIPLDSAREMLPLCIGKIIKKERYFVPVVKDGSAVRSFDGGLFWEVDVFHEEHEGLIIAEVELPSENEKFELPSWVGKEVTGDRRYYNSVLSAE